MKFTQMLMVAYLTAWTISPPLQIDTIFRLLAVACAIMWFFLAYIRGFKLRTKLHYYALLFGVAVLLIQVLESGSISSILKPISFYILIVAFFMFEFYQDRWEELRLLLPIVFILLTVWNFQTFRVLQTDATIARRIVRDDEEMYAYMRQGVGGYALLYPQVCMFPAAVMWLLRALRRAKWVFLLGAVWIVSYYLFLISAGYSIAIFTTVVSLVILFFYKRESTVLALTISLTILLAFLYVLVHSTAFQNTLLNFFDGTKVAYKIRDIVESANNPEMADSIASRIDRYEGSLELMLHYPFIGSLWFRSGGGHSAVLDTVAKYGLWGGYVFQKLLYAAPKEYKTHERKRVRSVANASLVAMVLITVLDSAPYQFMMMFVVVVPVLMNDIEKWEDGSYASPLGS